MIVILLFISFWFLIIDIHTLSSPSIKLPSSIHFNLAGHQPFDAEQYFCMARKLGPAGTYYITEFEANITRDGLVERMELYACSSFSQHQSWYSCPNTVCGSFSAGYLLYAWSKGVAPMVFPSQVAFDVGNDVGLPFVVLRVQYIKTRKEIFLDDNSAFSFHLLPSAPLYQADVLNFITPKGNVLNEQLRFSDATCTYFIRMPLHLFAVHISANEKLWKGAAVYAFSSNGANVQELASVNTAWPNSLYSLPQLVSKPLNQESYLATRCFSFSIATFFRNDKFSLLKYRRGTFMDHDETLLTEKECTVHLFYFTKRSHKRDYLRRSSIECLDNSRHELNDILPSVEKVHIPRSIPESYLHGSFSIGSSDLLILSSSQPIQNVKALWIKDWSVDGSLGMVVGMSMDVTRNHLLLFHQGRRDLVENDNIFPFTGSAYKLGGQTLSYLPEDTIVHVHPDTGKVISQWGAGLFITPHGIRVSYDGKSVWVTDVEAHLVMMFLYGQWTQPEIVLGKPREPGQDIEHFCGPTDVVVNKKGEVFVADGYCNSRIVKFSPSGKFVKAWGSTQDEFQRPHSLTILHEREWICVADMDRAAIECFDFDGTFKKRIVSSHDEFGDKLISIAWDPKHEYLFGSAFVVGEDSQSTGISLAFVMDFSLSNETHSRRTNLPLRQWRDTIHDSQLSLIHDVVVSSQSDVVFLTQIGQRNAVKKFHFLFPNATNGKEKLLTGMNASFLRHNYLLILLCGLLVPSCLIALLFFIIRARRRIMRSRLISAALRRRGETDIGHNRNTRRFGRGAPFQPLRQDESDMEETVSFNLLNNGLSDFAAPLVRDANGINVTMRSRDA